MQASGQASGMTALLGVHQVIVSVAAGHARMELVRRAPRFTVSILVQFEQARRVLRAQPEPAGTKLDRALEVA